MTWLHVTQMWNNPNLILKTFCCKLIHIWVKLKLSVYPFVLSVRVCLCFSSFCNLFTKCWMWNLHYKDVQSGRHFFNDRKVFSNVFSPTFKVDETSNLGFKMSVRRFPMSPRGWNLFTFSLSVYLSLSFSLFLFLFFCPFLFYFCLFLIVFLSLC